MNIVYALLKNDKYSIKIVSRMHISFLLSVESAQQGLNLLIHVLIKESRNFFSIFSISELANWVKLKTIKLFNIKRNKKVTHRAEQNKNNILYGSWGDISNIQVSLPRRATFLRLL